MPSRRHCGLLSGKWERGSDLQQRAGGKAQRACRNEKGIEVLTGQWRYGSRVNKFQRRPVACAVRDAEARSLLHGRLALQPIPIT